MHFFPPLLFTHHQPPPPFLYFFFAFFSFLLLFPNILHSHAATSGRCIDGFYFTNVTRGEGIAVYHTNNRCHQPHFWVRGQVSV